MHNCLVHTAHKDKKWHFLKESVDVSGNFCSNNSDSLIKAAIAGVGIIFTPESLVTEEVQQKKLIAILPQLRSDHVDIYASYPAHKYVPMKTKVFIDFLHNEIE
jgi:DNA-binding transcriptional LysR family regulator